MDTDELVELEKQLKECYEKMKKLIMEKDELLVLIMELEFQIFNEKYRIYDKGLM